MSTADRRAKVTEMETDMKKKKDEQKALEKEVKELTKTLELIKLGGQKPDRVMQLVSDAEFRENCEHRTCVLAFLPHILDGGAEARNGFLKTIETGFKKAKADGHPVGFMWLQGGDQFEIEEKMSLQFGFPAVVAINVKKERFGIHRGTFDKDSVSSFLSSMMVGRVPLQPLPKGLKFSKSDPWDGKDGELPKEEEL
jgi:protein disulfide-isomerase A6